MTKIGCTMCIKTGCHPLSRIGGFPYCLRCFGIMAVDLWRKHRLPITDRFSPAFSSFNAMTEALRTAHELESAASKIEEFDTDAGRRELATDILEDLRRHIPALEREYYSLAQSLLPADLQAPRVCCRCGRTGAADDPDWLYWDLCGDEECGARDAGARVIGDAEDS